jgi:hypothetical protein
MISSWNSRKTCSKTSHRFVQNFLWIALFALISSLICIGILPILVAPVVADDLLVLTNGLVSISEAPLGEIPKLMLDNMKMSTTADHVLPINGAITFLQNLILYYLMPIVQNPLDTWSFLLVGWHLLSLISLSYLIQKILFDEKRLQFRNFFAIYAFVGLTFISVTQIHSVWKETPVISYGIVGSGTAALSFLYLAGFVSILRKPSNSWLQVLTVSLIGILGLLLYEMFMAAVVASGALYFLTKLRAKTTSSIIEKIKHLLIFTLPTLFFLCILLFRTMNRSDDFYDGTAIGDWRLVLPVLITGIYGALPLAYLDLSTSFLGQVNFNFLNSLPFATAFGALFAVGLLSLGFKNTFAVKVKRDNLRALFTALILLWVVGTLIFSYMSKYQTALFFKVGMVYNFYTFGNLAVVGILTTWFFCSSRFGKSLIVTSLLLIGAYTNIYNTELVKHLNNYPPIKTYSKMFDSLKSTEETSQENCKLQSELRSSNLPESYKNAVISNFTQLYFHKSGRVYCS